MNLYNRLIFLIFNSQTFNFKSKHFFKCLIFTFILINNDNAIIVRKFFRIYFITYESLFSIGETLLNKDVITSCYDFSKRGVELESGAILLYKYNFILTRYQVNYKTLSRLRWH